MAGVAFCAVAMVMYSRVDRGKREILGMVDEVVEQVCGPRLGVNWRRCGRQDATGGVHW